MFPRYQFMTRPESIYHRSWGFTPWQIIAWSLKQLGLGGGLRGEDVLAVGSFVLLGNVEVGRDSGFDDCPLSETS